MVAALQSIGTRQVGTSAEIRIFIVDDEESSLAALGYRLMKDNPNHNYKVYCFNTGEDCVKHLYLRPKLIIMDQYLVCAGEGTLCGAGLLRKIRRIDPDVPLVIISGKRKPEAALESEQDDSYYYLVKDRAAHESVRKILGMIRPALVH